MSELEQLGQQEKDSFRKLAMRIAISLVAPLLIGLGSAALTGWVMVQLLDNRVTVLETKAQLQEPLPGKVDRLETTIDRHEKALDRDFLRHEQIVASLTIKTEDQEKRLTRVEAMMDEVQATLKEIQADIKTLIRGYKPMSFKEDLDNDIFAVFLNLEEFGEQAEIAGHAAVPMVVESLALEMPPSSSDTRQGVSYEGVTVYVAASDVPEELFAQKTVTFKNEEWFVLSATCEGGLKTIQLYRERA